MRRSEICSLSHPVVPCVIGFTLLVCLLAFATLIPDQPSPIVVFRQSLGTSAAATSKLETVAREPAASTGRASTLEPSSIRLASTLKPSSSRLAVFTSKATATTSTTSKPPLHSAHGLSVYRLEVVKTYPHDSKAFTQGLVYLGNDTLYESTGMYGESNVRKVNLKTGAVVASMPNPPNDFGEGLAYYKGFLWQVTWQTRTIHQYDPITLKRVGTYTTPSELDYRDGWGLASTSDGMSRFYDKASLPTNEKLYLTDSGTKLYQIEFVDGHFRLVRKVSVRTPSGTLLQMPNELELFDEDVLWANIFGKDCIAQINPETGKVIGWILADNLEQQMRSSNNVFNGIAYDRKNKRIFVTGKRWNLMYEVKLVPVVGMPHKDIEHLCVPRFNVFHRR